MRVFVTGATGFIGSAVVKELISAGYQVLGLARSEAGLKAVADAGAQAHAGDLSDLDSLKAGAAACDGVIHTAFIHDFSKFAENCAIDAAAIAAMGEVLMGSDRPIIVTSGVALLAPGRVATEDMPPPIAPNFPRKSEAAMEALVARGVRASVVRLAPTVHGEGDHGFVPGLIAIARAKGVSAYVGDGQNRWPAVHRIDAATLYRLVLEKGVAGGRYHGIAEEGIVTKDIAEAIGRGLKLPVVSKPADAAGEHFGFLGHFFALDCAASSARTSAQLGWSPVMPSLLPDLNRGHYFA